MPEYPPGKYLGAKHWKTNALLGSEDLLVLQHEY